MKNIQTKEIGAYDCNEKLIETYSCIREAASKLNVSKNTINRRLKDHQTINGVYLKHTNPITEKNRMPNVDKNVRFDIEEASKTLNFVFWELRECPICKTKFYARKKYQKLTCSTTCLDKYVELHKTEINNKQRIKSVEIYKRKSKDEIAREHEKNRQTCLQRYGATSFTKTKEYHDKMVEKWSHKDWSERSRKTTEKTYEKYKEICTRDNLELLDFHNRNDCTVKCKKCGTVFHLHMLGYLTEKTTTNVCRVCHPIKPTFESKASQMIESILDKYQVPYHKNNRYILSPFELDFFIPKHNLAIEVDGNWWHSEKNGRGFSYHVDKTKGCLRKGIKLIHVFEDEIVNKPHIVEGLIKDAVGIVEQSISSQDCIVKKISVKEKREFLNINHISGDCASSYNIGLFHDGELISVGAFLKTKTRKNVFELVRFVNKIGYRVNGAITKLTNYFGQLVSYGKIVTYADVRWFGMNPDDTEYSKNGFIFEQITNPDFYYFDIRDYLTRLNRLDFTKRKLQKMGFDVGDRDEREVMLENGYDAIWDCGYMVFTKNREP